MGDFKLTSLLCQWLSEFFNPPYPPLLVYVSSFSPCPPLSLLFFLMNFKEFLWILMSFCSSYLNFQHPCRRLSSFGWHPLPRLAAEIICEQSLKWSTHIYHQDPWFVGNFLWCHLVDAVLQFAKSSGSDDIDDTPNRMCNLEPARTHKCFKVLLIYSNMLLSYTKFL